MAKKRKKEFIVTVSMEGFQWKNDIPNTGFYTQTYGNVPVVYTKGQKAIRTVFTGGKTQAKIFAFTATGFAHPVSGRFYVNGYTGRTKVVLQATALHSFKEARTIRRQIERAIYRIVNAMGQRSYEKYLRAGQSKDRKCANAEQEPNTVQKVYEFPNESGVKIVETGICAAPAAVAAQEADMLECINEPKEPKTVTYTVDAWLRDGTWVTCRYHKDGTMFHYNVPVKNGKFWRRASVCHRHEYKK